MSVWDSYTSKIETRGTTKRGAALKREIHYLNTHVPDTLSYQNVMMFPPEFGYNIDSDEMRAASYYQDVAIINSDNLNEKTIIALPGEDIPHGVLVYWMGNHWLVSERDPNDTVYIKAKMLQCNYLLKWVTDTDEIIEQWCLIEDGTKLKHICYVCLVWHIRNDM